MSMDQDQPVAPESGRALIRWRLMLVWFMRVVALAWMVKGLSYWLEILGAPGVPAFEGRALSYQATVIYFAIINLVAAVGLWLTSTWGGVLWLLALMSNVILAAFFPAIINSGTVSLAVNVGLVVAYLTISWLASQEEV